MAKAEARVCVGSDRCYALPSDAATARSRCTAAGRCHVGLIVSKGGRESHDVWLEVATGLVTLVRQTEAGVGDGRSAALVAASAGQGDVPAAPPCVVSARSQTSTMTS
jgi:hypothetical protein